MPKEKKEKKMPVQITLGMAKKPYWKMLIELCEKAGRNPAEVIHRLIDENIDIELEILSKEIELREQIKEKKGGGNEPESRVSPSNRK